MSHYPLLAQPSSFPSCLTGSSAKYEPLPWYCHISESVGSKVVVQGGWTKDFSEKSRQQLTLKLGIHI